MALPRGIFANPGTAPGPVKPHLSPPVGRIWAKLPAEHKAVLQLLSALDIAPAQVKALMEGATDVELSAQDLLDNPYFAATCTYGMPEHVPFSTVDRALYPPTHVTWTPPVPDEVQLEGPLDRRRIEAPLTDVLERQGTQGDTVIPQGEAIDLANWVNLSQPPNLTGVIIAGLDLDRDSILDWPHWSPLTSIDLADGTPACKLTRYEETSKVIRDRVGTQL